MDKLLTNAALCHEQAERTRALAIMEMDQTKRRLLFALAEQYYLLHDQLVELNRHLLVVCSDTDRATAS